MSTGARVQDLEAIRMFRAALVKFIETSGAAVTDSEGEITKKMGWLESEQDRFWQLQIRKWQDEVTRAKDAVRMKKMYKDSTGKPQSAFDEEKHLKKCQATLAVAEEKLNNVRKYARELQREHLLYRGGVQRLQTMISSDLPNGINMLENVLQKLDAYMNAGPALATSDAGVSTSTAAPGEDSDANMKRSADEATKEESQAEESKTEELKAEESEDNNSEPKDKTTPATPDSQT